MGAATLLLATLLAAPSATRLDAAVDAAAQAGPALGPGDPYGAGRGVDLTPSLTALFQQPGFLLTGNYAPRFLLRDGVLGSGVRHSGLFAGTLDPGRTLRLVASERFLYGRNDFAWDPGAKRPFDLLEAIAPVIPDDLLSDHNLAPSLADAKARRCRRCSFALRWSPTVGRPQSRVDAYR